jgi:hypothetical protein
MPLYLVRWPNLSAALVKASSEDELIDTLDELSDPTGCTWQVYRGPVWIEFDYPVSVEDPTSEGAKSVDELVVGDLSSLEEGLQPSIPDTDTGLEMAECIGAFAFPNTSPAVLQEVAEPELREAVRKDLERLVMANWQRQQIERGDAPEKVAARILRTSVRQARYMMGDRGERGGAKAPVEPIAKAKEKHPPPKGKHPPSTKKPRR